MPNLTFANLAPQSGDTRRILLAKQLTLLAGGQLDGTTPEPVTGLSLAPRAAAGAGSAFLSGGLPVAGARSAFILVRFTVVPGTPGTGFSILVGLNDGLAVSYFDAPSFTPGVNTWGAVVGPDANAGPALVGRVGLTGAGLTPTIVVGLRHGDTQSYTYAVTVQFTR